MSGFAGVISLDGAPPDMRLLERMAQTLAFRGPDGTHITTKAGAGFCFTFLRTGPAPQCPSQPCSLDGRVWLIGDVRLDGRDDLRRKLEQHGDEIERDVTDEELVLRTWRRWGEEGIAELIGDYAFVLWDAEARILRCWRDLMGARPFFYARSGNRLYFSNTLNAIRCAPAVSRELDHYFIGDFLLQGSCSHPGRTVFREISRLPGGHTVAFSGIQFGLRRFTSFPIDAPLYLKHEEEYVEEFRSIFERAILERLPHGAAAIFMSGGLDSTTLAAVAVDCARKRGLCLDLRAYTVDHRPLFNDQEGQLANLTARHIGIPIEVHSGAAYLPYADWQTNPPPLPEPYHEPFQSQYVELNRSVAQHTAIALNGYGGDGVLTGQTWPYLRELARGGRFGTMIGVFGGYVLKHKRIPPLRGGFRSKLKDLINPTDSMAGYPPWLTSDFETAMGLRDRWHELHEPRPTVHPWHCKGYAVLNSEYWPIVQEGEDAATTGVPVEARAPFLDSRIQRYLLRIPPLPLCIDKELVRRMVFGLLPETIRLRPKTPFEGDQVALQMSTYAWSPTPLPEAPAVLRQFVDWERLRGTLECAVVCFPWPDLRPISLLHWLRGIEND